MNNKDDILYFTLLPESKEMFEEKIEEHKKELRELNQTLDEVFRAKANGGEQWVFELHSEDINKQIQQHTLSVKKFQRLLDINQGKKLPPSKFDVDVLRQIPISNILGPPVRSSGGRGYYRCIFHEDKTPSLVTYLNNNSWHCFSCQRGSSVIDLVMQKEEVSFVEALKILNNYG